jgi:arylsulfatase A-like enzyme
MGFTNFYGQLSCTPGRAAIQTGRIPNRSGMTTVAFQGGVFRMQDGRLDRCCKRPVIDLFHRQMAIRP